MAAKNRRTKKKDLTESSDDSGHDDDIQIRTQMLKEKSFVRREKEKELKKTKKVLSNICDSEDDSEPEVKGMKPSLSVGVVKKNTIKAHFFDSDDSSSDEDQFNNMKSIKSKTDPPKKIKVDPPKKSKVNSSKISSQKSKKHKSSSSSESESEPVKKTKILSKGSKKEANKKKISAKSSDKNALIKTVNNKAEKVKRSDSSSDSSSGKEFKQPQHNKTRLSHPGLSSALEYSIVPTPSKSDDENIPVEKKQEISLKHYIIQEVEKIQKLSEELKNELELQSDYLIKKKVGVVRDSKFIAHKILRLYDLTHEKLKNSRNEFTNTYKSWIDTCFSKKLPAVNTSVSKRYNLSFHDSEDSNDEENNAKVEDKSISISSKKLQKKNQLDNSKENKDLKKSSDKSDDSADSEEDIKNKNKRIKNVKNTTEKLKGSQNSEKDVKNKNDHVKKVKKFTDESEDFSDSEKNNHVRKDSLSRSINKSSDKSDSKDVQENFTKKKNLSLMKKTPKEKRKTKLSVENSDKNSKKSDEDDSVGQVSDCDSDKIFSEDESRPKKTNKSRIHEEKDEAMETNHGEDTPNDFLKEPSNQLNCTKSNSSDEDIFNSTCSEVANTPIKSPILGSKSKSLRKTLLAGPRSSILSEDSLNNSFEAYAGKSIYLPETQDKSMSFNKNDESQSKENDPLQLTAEAESAADEGTVYNEENLSLELHLQTETEECVKSPEITDDQLLKKTKDRRKSTSSIESVSQSAKTKSARRKSTTSIEDKLADNTEDREKSPVPMETDELPSSTIEVGEMSPTNACEKAATTEMCASPTNNRENSALSARSREKSASPVETREKSASPVETREKSPSRKSVSSPSRKSVSSPIEDREGSLSATEASEKSSSPFKICDKSSSSSPTKTRKKSSSRSPERKKSPSRSPAREKSSSRSKSREKSPSASPTRERSLSEDREKSSSPSPTKPHEKSFSSSSETCKKLSSPSKAEDNLNNSSNEEKRKSLSKTRSPLDLKRKQKSRSSSRSSSVSSNEAKKNSNEDASKVKNNSDDSSKEEKRKRKTRSSLGSKIAEKTRSSSRSSSVTSNEAKKNSNDDVSKVKDNSDDSSKEEKRKSQRKTRSSLGSKREEKSRSSSRSSSLSNDQPKKNSNEDASKAKDSSDDSSKEEERKGRKKTRSTLDSQREDKSRSSSSSSSLFSKKAKKSTNEDASKAKDDSDESSENEDSKSRNKTRLSLDTKRNDKSRSSSRSSSVSSGKSKKNSNEEEAKNDSEDLAMKKLLLDCDSDKSTYVDSKGSSSSSANNDDDVSDIAEMDTDVLGASSPRKSSSALKKAKKLKKMQTKKHKLSSNSSSAASSFSSSDSDAEVKVRQRSKRQRVDADDSLGEKSKKSATTRAVKKRQRAFNPWNNKHYKADKKLRMKCSVKLKRLSQRQLDRHKKALDMSKKYVENKKFDSLINIDNLKKKSSSKTAAESGSDNNGVKNNRTSARKKKAAAANDLKSVKDHLDADNDVESDEDASDGDGAVAGKGKIADVTMKSLVKNAENKAKEALLKDSSSSEPETQETIDESGDTPKSNIKKQKKEKKAKDDETVENDDDDENAADEVDNDVDDDAVVTAEISDGDDAAAAVDDDEVVVSDADDDEVVAADVDDDEIVAADVDDDEVVAADVDDDEVVASDDDEEDDGDKKKKNKKKGGDKDWQEDDVLNFKLSGSESEEKPAKRKKAKDESGEEKSESSSPLKRKSKRQRKKLVLDSDSNAENKSSGDEFHVSESDKEEKEEKKKKGRKRRGKPQSSDYDSSSSEKRPKGKRKRIKKVETESESDADSPSKGRKNIRKVLKDKHVADDTKKAAQDEEERLKRIAERQRLFNEMYDQRLASEAKVDKLVLDIDEETKEELVVVDPELVKRLKPHQAQGIKFMWDACFESLKQIEKSEGSGCIIAHCMGLGKTFQVVTLVHTLLCHEETGVRTVMIVCPLSTVLNWVNEFHMWLKHTKTGDEIEIYELTKNKKNVERKCQLQSWQRTGGVLIIGYEMFRNLTSTGKKMKKAMQESINRSLVDPGADLVVCDEGHLLKNEDSALSKAMKLVKTYRRIVLTGTPLQNNLKEYHCMVQFVKPNLLGTKKEFLNRFVNPITNGQFDDSTPYDVKLMKKRAHVLHKMLEGSVQRFDYSVLTPFLPPKQEYVIFVRLSEVQISLYRYYLENLARRTGGRNGTLFADFQELQRIWTHPFVLRLNAEKVEKANEKKRMEASDSEGSLKDFIDDGSDSEEEPSYHSTSDENSDIECLDSDKEKFKRSTRLNPKAEEPEVVPNQESVEEHAWWSQFVDEDHFKDLRLSTKLLLLFGILKESEQIGDKVLVFSQSLYSLTLIEHFLSLIDNETQEGNDAEFLDHHCGNWSLGLDYFRLDGSTSAENRSSWCKIFNNPKNTRARLFLISTRAGGLGINLTAANRVIIFDASWNPSHDVQSIFRIYRFGQKKPCYVYRFLAAGTMEEKIYNRQVTKLSLSCRVVDEQQIERHYTNSDLAELYQFESYLGQSQTLNLPKDRLLAEIFLKYKDYVWNYHEHDSLLENKAEEELDEEERKQAWQEYEDEKQGKRQMVNMGMGMNAGMNNLLLNHMLANMNSFPEFEAMKGLLQKDYPNLTPLQLEQAARQAMLDMYRMVDAQAMNQTLNFAAPQQIYQQPPTIQQQIHDQQNAMINMAMNRNQVVNPMNQLNQMQQMNYMGVNQMPVYSGRGRPPKHMTHQMFNARQQPMPVSAHGQLSQLLMNQPNNPIEIIDDDPLAMPNAGAASTENNK